MKARIGDWRIEADVTRDLASNPHRVELILDVADEAGARTVHGIDLSAVEAADLGASLDAIASALVTASDADSCDRCGMPCDPGETYCPTCEEASR